MLAALVLSLLPCVAAFDDVAQWLERLASPSATERERAQRWLSGNLRSTDLADVAEAVRAGGLEVRLRVSDALAAEDRHLELCVLLATDLDPAVREAGRAAVREMLTRWNPALAAPEEAQRTLPPRWAELATRTLSVDLGAGSLADQVDRLARLGGGPAELVLDPSLDPSIARPPTPQRLVDPLVTGTWGEVLGLVLRQHRVTYEVLGHAESAMGAELGIPWVRLCKQGGERSGDAGVHMVRWCEGVVRELDPAWNAACARALAASGWPAAVQWLEERWQLRGDEAGLAGVLLAAGRGRVAPALTRPDVVRRLLADVDRALAAADPGAARRAERVARALAAAGPTGIDGEPLTPVGLAGWEALSAASRWVRLVAIEGAGRGDREAAARAAAELAKSGAPALRLQALRALVACREPGDARPAVGDPAGLFRWAAEHGWAPEVGRLLGAVEARVPPGGWALELGESARRAVLEWAVAVAEESSFRAALEPALAQALSLEGAARELRRLAGLGQGERLRGLLSAARAAADPRDVARWTRLELRAGLAGPDVARAELERIGAARRTSEDLLDLGTLAASPEDLGGRARQVLLAELETDADSQALLAAFARALEVLRAARLDSAADELAAQLRKAALERDHPLGAVVMAPDWPPLPAPRALDLEELDRRLDLAGL